MSLLLAQSCLILCNPMDCSPPGSSTHEIVQAKILDWIAIVDIYFLLYISDGNCLYEIYRTRVAST